MLLRFPDGMWAAIAALNGIIVDKGGSYRARAATISVAACANAALMVLGTMVGGGSLLLVAPLVFLVGLGAGLTRALGAAGTGVGIQMLITLLVALAVPVAGPRADAALDRAALTLVGGAWAMLLVLALWPLRPYRPARLAVARCWRELADYVGEIARRVAAAEPLDTELLAGRATAVRQAVEAAAGILASTRRGRTAETGRGARLVQLHGTVDRTFAHALAIADAVDALPSGERDPAAQVLLAAVLSDVVATLRAVADATEEERSRPPLPVTWSGVPLRAPERPGPGAAGAGATGEGAIVHAYIAVLLDRMAQLAATAAGAAAGLEKGRYDVSIHPDVQGADGGAVQGAAAALRAVLAPGSLILRHALRVALVTTLAVVLTGALGLRYGYWVSITVVILLQPYTGTTTARAVQRVVGTIIGGAVAAGLTAAFRDPVAILVMVPVFVALSQALFPVSYVAFAALLTPAFVLLVELRAGDWGLAWVRVLNTVLGGALALAAARLLWPQPEWNRLPTHLAAALRAVREYLRVVADALTASGGDGSAVRGMAAARREAGLAAINAEESFQRLLGEDGGAPARMEAAMAILASIRNLANSVAALALARHAAEPTRVEELSAVTGAAGAALEEMAAAIQEGRPPSPLPSPPELPDPPVAPLLRTRLARIQRAVEALHHSATRWAAPGPGAPSEPGARPRDASPQGADRSPSVARP
ncbi:MAG TPA: FUSC family protein [Gemmatimonadales bacterium]